MKILKILYICWIVLVVFVWLIISYIAHNPDIIADFLAAIGICIFPLTIYHLWCFAITSIKKHLKMFFVSFAYYPLAFIFYCVIKFCWRFIVNL